MSDLDVMIERFKSDMFTVSMAGLATYKELLAPSEDDLRKAADVIGVMVESRARDILDAAPTAAVAATADRLVAEINSAIEAVRGEARARGWIAAE